MFKHLRPAITSVVAITVCGGLLFPGAIYAIANVAFHDQAHGSLVTVNGKVVGSELIGQNFAKPEYFQPRPSAAGNDGYDPTASSGSNYGPTNQKLVDRVKASIDKFRKDNPDYTGPLPADLVTASASGLDPHLSPDSASAQAARVAKARGVSTDQVSQLIAQQTEGPDLGVLGEPRVNVLKLNLALDEKLPKK